MKEIKVHLDLYIDIEGRDDIDTENISLETVEKYFPHIMDKLVGEGHTYQAYEAELNG